MSGEHRSSLGAAEGFGESTACMLLIRAPSDRAVYEAFRALCALAPAGQCQEHLWIEGDLPLTSGLCEPQVPATVERLLNADCEMIDKLELEFGGLKWIYTRSGGHAPFRESFFDEVRIELVGKLTLSHEQLLSLTKCALVHLHVLSHTSCAPFGDLIAEVQAESGRSLDLTHTRGERRI